MGSEVWNMVQRLKKLLQKKSYLHIQNITVFIFDDSPITKLMKKLGEFNVTNNSTSNSTLHFEGKKLETNSSRNLQHVVDTINPNWLCP